MTYLMVNHRTQQGLITVFARKEDGMVVGSVMGTVVQLGEDPGQIVTRVFVDRDAALRWIKQRLWAVEQGRNIDTADFLRGDRCHVEFEEREGDPMVTPVSSMPSARM